MPILQIKRLFLLQIVVLESQTERLQKWIAFERVILCLTSISSGWSYVFNHLKVCLANAIHNFGWVTIICQNRGQQF